MGFDTRYVRANYGDRCFFNDSSYKRYNRYHCGGDTLIFNYNYGNNCCGGHRRVGFWGGVGMALGCGAANFLVGGLNLLGSWLGLGNGGNNYGWGNWNLGGGSWNLGGGSWNLDGGYSPIRSRRSDRSERVEVRTEIKEVGKENADAEAITKISEDVAALRKKIANGETVDPKDVDALRERINDKLKGQFDGVQDELDKRNLKAELDKLDNGAPVAPKATELSDALKATGILEADLKALKEAGLDDDAIIAMNDAGLTPANMKALKAIGVDYNKDENALTCPSELTVDNLKALAEISSKTKIPVAMGYNPQSKDQWIKGFINKDSIKLESNKLTYTIDCKDVTGATFQNEYAVSQKEGTTYNISVKTQRNGQAHGEKEYTWSTTNKRLERNGDALVTES